MGINKAILLGRLGRDPEITTAKSGQTVARFSVATGERRKGPDGQWIDASEWHRILVFGKTAEACQKALHKGSMVYIEGRLQTRKWQAKDGTDRYTTEIIALNVQFCGQKGESTGAGAPPPDEGPEARSNIEEPAEQMPLAAAPAPRPTDGTAEYDFDDDDIPF